MRRQGSFLQAEYAKKKKQTRRDKFLAEMERVVPWARLVERLQPLYPKGARGRPPIGLERMLRIYFLQQWYGLADVALEDALYDSQALRIVERRLQFLGRNPRPVLWRRTVGQEKLVAGFFAHRKAIAATDPFPIQV